MEFVGNQINFKTVLAALTAAFLIGRINLFGGTFPAAIALITVMAAVSTVYIYLVPVMAAGMMTFSGQGMDFYGDMLAMIFCGLFFLFFHEHRFTINQRTAVAVCAMVIFNCSWYAWENLLYLLSLQTLVKEAVALMIYIRVFNTLARMIFVGKGSDVRQVSGEKAGFALVLAAVSLIGAIGFPAAVFPLWVMAVLITAYCSGIQWALATAVTAQIFWIFRFHANVSLFSALFIGLTVGWFLASLLEGRYRKTILGLAVFLAAAFSVGGSVSAGDIGGFFSGGGSAVFGSFGAGQIYGAAAACAVFIAVPSEFFVKFWCFFSERLMPETVTDMDLRLAAVRKDLTGKRDTFRSLGKLYAIGEGRRQILSYQFEGMARTVDGILEDLTGVTGLSGEKAVPPLVVGEASYAFEEISGDSSLSFSFGRNSQALIISDGMGKGSRAAAESSVVVTTLSKLLSAGFDVDLAVKTVNAVLMSDDSQEMFASVDLAIINKETGRTRIFKMGAASTFVKHDGKVTMLKRSALPVGILEGVKLGYIDVRLKKGDLLVMVSDGVTDCDRKDPDCGWLRERLTQIGSRNPDTVAELIVNKAAEKYGIRERDDLTVMVAAI